MINRPTDGDDVIEGTAGDDVIDARREQHLTGLGGNDYLRASGGRGKFYGDAGMTPSSVIHPLTSCMGVMATIRCRVDT